MIVILAFMPLKISLYWDWRRLFRFLEVIWQLYLLTLFGNVKIFIIFNLFMFNKTLIPLSFCRKRLKLWTIIFIPFYLIGIFVSGKGRHLFIFFTIVFIYTFMLRYLILQCFLKRIIHPFFLHIFNFMQKVISFSSFRFLPTWIVEVFLIFKTKSLLLESSMSCWCYVFTLSFCYSLHWHFIFLKPLLFIDLFCFIIIILVTICSVILIIVIFFIRRMFFLFFGLMNYFF